MPDPAPGVYGGGTPTGLVTFDDGYVAVGTVNADCCDAGDPASRRGIVWTSADGRSWVLHDPIAALEHSSLDGLTTDGTRLIAVGSHATPVTNEPAVNIRAVWVSTDGATWVRTAGAAPSFVAVGPQGLVGAVTTEGTLGAVSMQFVESEDGLTWASTSRRIEADLRGLAVAPDGTAMAVGAVAGARRADGSPTTDMVAWRSEDGTIWTGPETIANDALPLAITASQEGFFAVVAVSSQLPNGSVRDASEIWRLPRGADPQVALIPLGDEEGLDAIRVVGDVLVATGYATVEGTGNAMLWVSIDGGFTWGRVPDQVAFGGPDSDVAAVMAIPGGLLAVGYRWDAASAHPVPQAWISLR